MMKQVRVAFPEGIASEAQASALMAFERHLRVLTGLDVQVFKDKMRDDSKLRMALTPEERNHV